MTIPQFTAGQVLTAAELNAMVDAINAGGGKMEVQQFTASGTFTVPAGVTHAVAHITGGGGGLGTASSGTGGTSSVAFAGGTISAPGGGGFNMSNFSSPVAGPANSGFGVVFAMNSGVNIILNSRSDGATIVAGAAVTPAATITVTIGAGGVAGTFGVAGGSGYVWIEYQI